MTALRTGPDIQSRDWRAFAHALADTADALTMSAFRHHLDVRTKSDGSWVTQVDEDVEVALRKAILDEFPDHAVLGEEIGRHGPRDAPTWIIDPIDGTTNYVKRNPIFATLIAVQVGGQEVAGVVSAPALSTRWDGIAGGPAHQDGRVVHVSTVGRIEDAEVALGGLDVFVAEDRFDLAGSLAARAARVRGYGDFWQHCLVAAGSTDIAVEAEVKVWDLAAVKVVVEAAGGQFTDLEGRRTAGGGSALSTNGRLHDEVLALARSSRPRSA